MIGTNGALSLHYGPYAAAVIIHGVGLAVVLPTALFRREKLFKKLPPLLFLGGVVGMGTTILNNLAFSKISVSALLGLSLLGQMLCALLFDHYGILGTPKTPFQKGKWSGIALVCLGVIVLLLPFSANTALPALFSFLSGFSIVLSRTINGQLAKETSDMTSTLYNFGTGLFCSLFVLLAFGAGETNAAAEPGVLAYMGGIIGFFVVLLTNVAVLKVSAYDMTLLMFVGQVLTGVLLDAFFSGAFSIQHLIGGLFTAIGFAKEGKRKEAAVEK